MAWPLYTLTELTGKQVTANRQVMVATIEMTAKTRMVAIIAFLASLVLAIPFVLIFGSTGLVIIPVTIAAAVFLFVSQTSDTRISRASALRNRRTGRRTMGKFFVGLNPVDPSMAHRWMLTPSTVEVDPDGYKTDTDDLFGTPRTTRRVPVSKQAKQLEGMFE